MYICTYVSQTQHRYRPFGLSAVFILHYSLFLGSSQRSTMLFLISNNIVYYLSSCGYDDYNQYIAFSNCHNDTPDATTPWNCVIQQVMDLSVL